MTKNQSPGRTELTQQERAFVEEITRVDENKPSTLTEAFLRVNENARKWKPNAQRNEASAIYRRPVVKAAIRAKQAMLDAERRRSIRTSRTAIENALWKEAKVADRSSDRINALKALAQMLPEEDPNAEAVDSAATKEQLVAELESILQNKLGAAIDVTPQIPDQSPETTSDSTDKAEEVEDVEPTVVEPEVLEPESPGWDDTPPEEPAF